MDLDRWKHELRKILKGWVHWGCCDIYIFRSLELLAALHLKVPAISRHISETLGSNNRRKAESARVRIEATRILREPECPGTSLHASLEIFSQASAAESDGVSICMELLEHSLDAPSCHPACVSTYNHGSLAGVHRF